jgi:glycerol-3-phosphate dehydrogenase
LAFAENNMTRDRQLRQLADLSISWDLLVIGGGSSGLGVALDAVSRGYKTLLIEQADFAKGTSSRSTKLVHGGVRYLAQGHLKLVREASVERAILLRNAPHLVRNLGFIIPVYKQWDLYFYGIGLKLYDWIAGFSTLGASKILSAKTTIQKLPGIKKKGLTGGISYHDGQFDDARLAINLVQTIIDNNGTAINYMKLTGFLKDGQGKIAGGLIRDVETGVEYKIKAKAVVNATGVFADEILALDDPVAKKTLSVSQGVHIVLDKKFLPSTDALMIPRTSDGRVIFAVPWHDKLVVGTTDTPVREASLEPKALDKEIDFIIETVSTYLQQKPTRRDVLSVFAGQRPLAAPKEGKEKTKEISRSHKIIISDSGLFTMLGGKWTTFRRMGEDMVDLIQKHLHWEHKLSRSAAIKLHGYKKDVDWNDPLYYYGSDLEEIRARINAGKGEWISAELHLHTEMIIWAVEKEMARKIEDVLARRMRGLFLDTDATLSVLPLALRAMAEALGKDDDWIAREMDLFRRLAENYKVH